MTFTEIEPHVQLIHITNYTSELLRNYKVANIQIKQPQPTIYHPDDHCMLISVDKRFKYALFTDIISYRKRRATPITKEQFDKGEFPDVVTQINPKHKNYKIRVSARDFRDHEQIPKLNELKAAYMRETRKPDKIEGPLNYKGENVLIISNEDFWWAPYYSRDVFKIDARFHVKLIL